jgi:hypothetical protein
MRRRAADSGREIFALFVGNESLEETLAIFPEPGMCLLTGGDQPELINKFSP